MIPDRFFYPLMALVVAAIIGLACVYPQGQGDRSPAPFGHAIETSSDGPAAAAVPAAPSADGAQVRTPSLK